MWTEPSDHTYRQTGLPSRLNPWIYPLKNMRTIIVLCVLLCLTGCGSGSFLGSRFEDFSTYYNKFYNAKRSLNEGIRDFEEKLDQQPIDQGVFLSLFERSQQANTQRKPFEDAVKKSADILRDSPNSKWVDDALLVIGKAWFFTLNFVGAEEKFNDILKLDSPLKDEANFWLARTLIASGAYEDAATHLQAILNAEDLASRWEPRYRLALAELYVRSENWGEAAVQLEDGLEATRDRKLAARAQFLSGQVLEQLERYEDAVSAYERVQLHKPFYELSYAAQFSAVRVLADHGHADEALIQLRRMERDDKNYDYRAKLAYLRGRVFMAQGRYSDALDIYNGLLYDPTTNGTSVRGEVHYTLGTFYRDVAVDYPYAAAHFDTASRVIKPPGSRQSSRQRATESEIPSPGAIIDSDEQAEIFGSFSEVMDQIVLMDSLLYLGTLDDSSFAAVVLELRRRRAKELEEMQKEMLQRQTELAFRSGVSSVGTEYGYRGAQVAGSEGEAGFLYHKDGVRMLQARQDFVSIWGERPLAPNWRRIAAIEAAQTETREDGQEESTQTYQLNTVMPVVDVSRVPRTEEKFHDMMVERAHARYELGNVLFLSMHQPDSASAWYRMVIDENRDPKIVQRAYYGLAEIHRTLGDTLAANRMYETIISDYPESDLSDQAHIRLARSIPDRASTDSLTLAEFAYGNYLQQWQGGVSEELISGLFHLGLRWPTTPVAPRAFYAAGRAYLEWAAEDSSDVLAVLPVPVDTAELNAAGFFPRRDTMLTASDSVLTLPRILRHISTSFPDSPQADPATRLLRILVKEQMQRDAIADSLTQVADSARFYVDADSLSLDSLHTEAVDSSATRQIKNPDSLHTRLKLDPATVEETVLSTRRDDPSIGSIDWSTGGYTIYLSTYTHPNMARASAVNLGQPLYDVEQPIDVYRVDVENGMEFRVGLGLFSTVQEADSVMSMLTGRLPEEARIVRIRNRWR